MSQSRSGDQARGLQRLLLLVRTARHLRPIQVLNRVSRRLPRRALRRGPPPPTRSSLPLDDPPTFLEREPSRLGRETFVFLNEERDVPLAEYGLSKPGLLWDYNFHYFDGLFANGTFREHDAEWIADWLEHVPALARPAWDPYPASRRIQNWVKWALATVGPLPGGFTESLSAQVRQLERSLEYHLLGNHLLSNAVALTLAGCFFSGPEAEGWLRRGRGLLRRELREQFLGDGAHFELSPVYHALMVEDLLDVLQVARGTGVELDPVVVPTVAKGLRWLSSMTRPDGRVPLFNDASHGVARSPHDVIGYGARLGVTPTPDGMEPLALLEPSGYFRYEHGRLSLFGDVGAAGPDYQPGHAHCDMLSFELCWDGRPIIVDTGTSTYEVGLRRSIERGTASHNTVQIDDLEQSEIWAGFRLARRARVLEVDRDPHGVSARIRAFPPAWHRVQRSWRFRDESVVVSDRVESAESRRAVARLHLHPDVRVRKRDSGWMVDELHVSFDGALDVRVVEFEYAPEFNRRVPATCLEVDFAGELHTTITTRSS